MGSPKKEQEINGNSSANKQKMCNSEYSITSVESLTYYFFLLFNFCNRFCFCICFVLFSGSYSKEHLYELFYSFYVSFAFVYFCIFVFFLLFNVQMNEMMFAISIRNL